MTLLPQHQKLIEASAITSEVSAARGYWSATKRAELHDLGFARAQQLVPALVVPVHDHTGQIANYQARPDTPRIKDGKPLKYETPAGSKMVLDVPPACRAALADPGVDLFITEGCRKADSAVSHGLCCVSLLGVWNWRGTNQRGGKTALADWESVALNGRRVFLAFDSDAVTKSEVAGALRRLKAFLESHGARVRVVYLPPAVGGGKTGLDDYLATGGTVHQLMDGLAVEEIRVSPPAPTARNASVHQSVQTPALASSSDLLGTVALVLHQSLAGETRLAKLAYLAASSRLLDGIPVSLAIKGPSAAGKSHLLRVVLSLFPPDAYYVLTAMSEHSLAYGEEPLAHRMLVIYEAAMLGGGGGNDRDPQSHFADYLLRSLLSEGHIRYETVEKDENGNLRTRLIEREGPTGLLTTTTAAALHPENETRLLSLTVDDSKEQTKAVMRLEAGAGHRREPVELAPWHEFQTWLQERSPQEVVIPYADRLADLIPPLAVRLRRDFPTLLCLIRTHALLRQLYRRRDPDGRIIATLDDYRAVRDLAGDLMADAVAATVSASVRASVQAVQKIIDGPPPRTFATYPQLAQALDLDRSAVSRRVRVCIREGYLVNQETRSRQPAQLVIGTALPEAQTLLPAADDLDLCTDALHAEGESGDTRFSPPGGPPDPSTRTMGRRKVCPLGHVCSLTQPTGSHLCCGHPEEE